MTILIDANRSLVHFSHSQFIIFQVKRCIRPLIVALILMFAGNAYAVITVGLAIQNDLDSNGNITVINGSKVKVIYAVLEDTDNDLNKKDRIELRRVDGDGLVSSVVRGKKKSGSVSLKVKNSEDEQLYVRYVRKTGTEIKRISHPDDADTPLLSIASANTSDLTIGQNALESAVGCSSTCRGSYTVVFTANAGGDWGSSAFSFGTTLEFAPTVHFIGVGDTPPAECSGTATMPEAAPGHLCVYETDVSNIGFRCITRQGTDWSCGASDRFGAALYVNTTGAGDAISVGTWAVTAP